MANVFVSHRRSDAAMAKRLANELRSLGNTVWLDEWELGIGKSIVGEMNRGLSDADYVVVCFSDAGVAPWMNQEWMSALARQLNGEGVTLLPVLLTGGSPPPIIADLLYADLTDWATGMSALSAAIV